METVSTAVAASDGSALTTAEREALKLAFAENGYFVVKSVVPRDDLTGLRNAVLTEFDRAKSSGELFQGGGTMSGHLNCFPGSGSRFMLDALEKRGILDLIREIQPAACRMPNVGCNLNLPGSVPQHLHTDGPFTYAFMIANVAVVDTTIENGAIQLVPGTHKQYYKYWRFAMERRFRHSIRVPMAQGDVLVRTSTVWHRGMPNRTDVARPMAAFTWEEGGSREQDPFAVEDGKIKFRWNWFTPTRMGRLREKVFIKVPISYSAFRFVDSLLTNKGY